MLRPWKLEIRLDYKSSKAIYLQIADAIITDVKSGRLKSGDALPGSRLLASMLQVNRNTIVEALHVLINEDWIVSSERKGTFVAETLPIGEKKRNSEVLHEAMQPAKTTYRISFDDGYPDTKIAPVNELARAYRQIFNRNAKWQMMGYGNQYGDPEFIDAIAQMLNHQRGMQVNPQSICITRGSQMAMYLTAQCLIEPGDIFLVESPGYKTAWKSFENAGAKIIPIPIDSDGLIIDEVRSAITTHKNIKGIYVTPHHQYPTTVTMSLQRRVELVRLSNTHNFTIIEDDYDNEFHYGYRPLLPISSIAELQHYIYIGTMSKVVAPALRIGYLASNIPAFITKIGDLRKIIDVQGDGIMEQAVLQLINDGTIRRHIKKVTQHYKIKRDNIAKQISIFLGNKVDFEIPNGGLAFWITPKSQVDWFEISQKLSKSGIRILTPDFYYKQEDIMNKSIKGMRIGFGSLLEKDLIEGIKALSKLLPLPTKSKNLEE